VGTAAGAVDFMWWCALCFRTVFFGAIFFWVVVVVVAAGVGAAAA
jgi:hypothetical protein